VAKIDLPASERLIGPLFNATRRIAVAFSPSGTVDRLNRMLDRAGNPSAWTIERIMGAKGALLLLGALLGVVWGGVTVRGILIAALLGAAFFFFPDLALYNAALRRQSETAKGLAEALDMLTVCVEAGQGFDGALLQVARNVEGPIAGEFARVLSEIQIGKSRGDAFAAMGDRVTLPEVRNFTTALVQADRLGLPIAAVLREQTATMRLLRKQRAEEQAQKVTVKIIFPLILCIFPVLFIVIMGPGAIRMIESFSRL
jgi:tight adherence protein C